MPTPRENSCAEKLEDKEKLQLDYSPYLGANCTISASQTQRHSRDFHALTNEAKQSTEQHDINKRHSTRQQPGRTSSAQPTGSPAH
eukprot:6826714-Pyramimonas_sp.AAC.1